jgi:hypothetical protein
MAANRLTESLRRLRRRLFALAATAGLGWGLACLAALLVASIWLDLVVELPPRLRIVASCASLVAATSLAAGILFAALRQGQPRRLAGRLDAAGRAAGQIVAGFDLAQRQTGETSPLSEGLTELAVDRAGEVASKISAAVAVPAHAARRSWLASASCAVVVALVALAAPRLAQTAWLRFSDPFGDHPPFSNTLLTVEPGDTRVIYAGGLDVLVSAAGPLPERVDLVLVGDEGEETLPMFPEADGKWKAQLSEIVTPCRYYARARGTRSHRYQIDVITVPRLETVRWRIVPPAYTGDAAYEGPTPSDGLAGLIGTQVRVWATSNRPLSRGALTIDEDGSRRDVPLTPPASESREVSGQFEIRAAGKFSLWVTDVAGQDSQDPFSGTITLLSDQRPLVRLMEPAEQSLATPTATLPVMVAAEDDYGISRWQLFRSLNDSRALPLELDVPAVRRSPGAPQTSAPRRLQQGTFLPLSTYELEPGDVIKLYARVEDNDPAGAKGTESPVATVQIISPEDYGRMLRAREGMDVFLSKYQQAQRRMESLAEEVEGLRKKLSEQPADSPASQEDRQRMEELAQKLEEEAAAIRESAKDLLPYDLDQALTSELKRLAKQLDQAAGDARAAGAKPGAKAGELEREMREMLERLQQEKKDFKQNVTQPLELLAEIYPLLEDQQRFVELYRRQRDLAERLASLAGRGQVDPFDGRRGEGEDDPALKSRMRDLEDEQRTLRDQLERLLDDIEEHAARVPDEPDYEDLVTTARDFAAAVRASAATEEMQRAETGLAGFSGSEGHEGAKKAADILEQFIKRCEAMSGQGEKVCRGLKFQPQESLPSDCMGNTLAQLLADAGFKQGNGAGMGSGGGYSARRSTLNNVGLYGNLPTRGNPTQARGGRRGAMVGGAGPSTALADAGQSAIEDNEAAVRAAGTAGLSIPARYRSRVQQYFQRIAEETGQRGEATRSSVKD